MTSKVAIGFLNVSQGVLPGNSETTSPCDLAVAAVGWETRCNYALPFYANRSEKITFLRFRSSDPLFDARKQASLVEARAILHDRVDLRELEISVDFHTNFLKLEQMIVERVSKIGRPLSVVMDVTCIPKRYFLFLIAMGFKRGLISRVDVVYTEGKYHPPSHANNADHLTLGFTSGGEWTSVQVPYLEGSNYTPDKRDLFVSIGAEVTQAVPIVERFEPAKLKLFQVNGSESRFPPGYLDVENHALNSLTDLPGTDTEAFDIGDVIGLAKRVLEGKVRMTTCLAIGAKPHALAFAVAALAADEMQVVCRNPQGYMLNDVSAAGVVHFFRLEDRFEPSAAWH